MIGQDGSLNVVIQHLKARRVRTGICPDTKLNNKLKQGVYNMSVVISVFSSLVGCASAREHVFKVKEQWFNYNHILTNPITTSIVCKYRVKLEQRNGLTIHCIQLDQLRFILVKRFCAKKNYNI